MAASKFFKKSATKKDGSSVEDPIYHSHDEKDKKDAESESSDADSSDNETSDDETGTESGSDSSSSNSSDSGSDSDSDSSSDSSSSDDSDSDSDSDSESGSDSDDDFTKEEELDDSSDDVDFRAFLVDGEGGLGSDSSDDEVRVVKSQKDKKFEELESTVTSIENATRINDWGVISSEFDKLNRQLPSLLKQNNGKVPRLFIKTTADLETAMLEAVEKQKVTPKKMNAVLTRGLNAVRQKIRKTNKEHAQEIEAYRKNPEQYMLEDLQTSVASNAAFTKKAGKKKFVAEEFESDAFETSPPAGGVATAGDDDGFTVVGSTSTRPVQYTPESIFGHLRTIVESRGRKNTDREEQIAVMLKLLAVATSDYQRIRVLLTLIPTRFDMASSSSGNYMSTEQWKLAEAEFSKLLDLLVANPNLVVVENAEEWDNDDTHPEIEQDQLFLIPGSIPSFVERLDDELSRSLQQLDPHTADYVVRLKDESALYTDIVRSQLYIERISKKDQVDVLINSLNRVVVRRLDHIYFKPSQVTSIIESQAWESIAANQDSELTPRAISDVNALISRLCTHLFVKSEGITRTRAILCQIYYLALHDQYYAARDMMLMSHLQDLIPTFDISTQILFNRALVQVGLCAFRAGNIKEAQSTLQEICGSNRQKELLAQGLQMQRFSQLSPEQERLEKQRQLPFHMHINLELLECVYLTCSMLLEIPLLAQLGSSPDLKKRVISKTFRRLLEFHERQVFTGPPENTRDHIMQASKALATGEWRKTSELISAIKIWDLMPRSTEIKEYLRERIQCEGLRTYIFTYAPFYDSLSISILSEMFELSSKRVSSIVSEMISHEDIRAALDQITNTIRFSKDVEVSRLQSLASALSEKAVRLIETNEKMLEQQTGNTGGRSNQGRGSGRGGHRGGNRGDRGDRTDRREQQ